jgi:cation:H+ antiporter
VAAPEVEGGALILTTAALVGGMALLYWGAEFLVRGSVQIGRQLRISPIVIGLTVVSVGTSAPELVVSLLAALRGSPDIVAGNVLGSNLANVGLILGIAAIIRPMTVDRRVIRREIPWMLGITLVALPVLWNLQVGRVEGLILALLLVVYLGFLVPEAREEGAQLLGEAGDKLKAQATPIRDAGLRAVARPLLLVLGGIVGLIAGGQGIVFGATALATAMGVSELLIGLSVVAVGTSLPELATTVVAAARNQADLAVGNVVGSNIFNLTFVLGGTGLLHPIPIQPRVLGVEYVATLAMSLLLIPVALGRSIRRREGVLLLLAYLGAWAFILSR